MLIKLSQDMVLETIKKIGAHKDSWPIFQAKSEILPVKLTEVRTPAANIIKQELLAVGGDAVTPLAAITGSEKYCDIMLMGTRKHYTVLLRKLQLMNYFGIPKIAEELTYFLGNSPVRTVLADGRELSYEHVQVMGIINATPDSFYSGSRVSDKDSVDVAAALSKAGEMLAAGATILDIGGESTRSGSAPITVAEEINRVVPVIKAIHSQYPEAIISIDTYHAQTAREALAAGAHIINDVTAMEGDPEMLQVVVESRAPIVLMHMRGTPKNMQTLCQYKDVVMEVADYLCQRANLLREQGVAADKIILDPGIGFAKNTEQNLLLLRDLKTLTSFGYPVLLACSRKTVIGQTLGDIPPEERLEGTIAASLQAVYAGVQLVRVHDVQENLRAIRMLEAIRK